MSTTAPQFRAACQLTGQVAERPSKFFAAMSAADDQAAAVEQIRDENAELRCRVDELTDELYDMRLSRDAWAERAEKAERDVARLTRAAAAIAGGIR
jgi:chromosome segregation ATPase